MTSIVWDDAIGERLAQLRGEAPSGRVFERHECPVSGPFHVEVRPADPWNMVMALGAHDMGEAHFCIHCGASQLNLIDGTLDVHHCTRRNGGRPKNWRMTQHLAAEAAKNPPKPKQPIKTSRALIDEILRQMIDSDALVSAGGGFTMSVQEARAATDAAYEELRRKERAAREKHLEYMTIARGKEPRIAELARTTREAQARVTVAEPTYDEWKRLFSNGPD